MLYVPRASWFNTTQFFSKCRWGVLSNKFIIFLWSIIRSFIPLLLYYINIKIIIVLSLFWIYMSFFGFFFIMLSCNCFWIILLWFFWNFRNSVVLRLSCRVRCIFIMLICNCFWFILLCFFFLNFHDFVSDFITKQSCFCCFWNWSFWSSFKRICGRLFTMIKKFLAIFTTQVFNYIFTNILTHIFSKRQKPKAFYKYSIFRLNWIADHFCILCFN